MLHNPIVSQAYTFRNFHIAREIGSSFVYVLSVMGLSGGNVNDYCTGSALQA
jgi:hypothetical protein